MFECFIGIGYSGAQTPLTRLKGLQVYAAQRGSRGVQRWDCRPAGAGTPLMRPSHATLTGTSSSTIGLLPRQVWTTRPPGLTSSSFQ